MSIYGTCLIELKKIITRYLFNCATLLSLFLILSACAKEPDKLGRDLLPASDSINVKVDASTLLNSYSISGKRIVTSDNGQNEQLYVLGSLKDSIFGYSSASILTGYHPSRLISVDTVRVVDSLVLYLYSLKYYGDTLNPLTLRVYEMDSMMLATTSYFSDLSLSEYCDTSTVLATTTFIPRDSSVTRVKITDPGILIKFATAPDSIFTDLLDFENYFYGLYLKVDQVSEKGGFAYLSMSSFSTGMAFYYNGQEHGDTSKVYEMSFTSTAPKVNLFSHDYTGFPVAAHLNTPGSNDSLIFIEGLAGASGRISLPDLETWRDKGIIAINKAELILPVDTILYSSLSVDDYPPKLILFSIGDDDAYEPLYDDRIDNLGTYFDGSYSKSQHAYIFNIGLYLQSYIGKTIESKDLVIVSQQSNSSANRVILKGATSASSPVKLKVIYTELF